MQAIIVERIKFQSSAIKPFEQVGCAEFGTFSN